MENKDINSKNFDLKWTLKVKVKPQNKYKSIKYFLLLRI